MSERKEPRSPTTTTITYQRDNFHANGRNGTLTFVVGHHASWRPLSPDRGHLDARRRHRRLLRRYMRVENDELTAPDVPPGRRTPVRIFPSPDQQTPQQYHHLTSCKSAVT